MHFYELEFLDAKRNHFSEVCQSTVLIKNPMWQGLYFPWKIHVACKKHRITTGQKAEVLIIWASELQIVWAAIPTKLKCLKLSFLNPSRYQTACSQSGGICTLGISMACICTAKTAPLFSHKHSQKSYIVNKTLMKEIETRPKLWLHTIWKRKEQNTKPKGIFLKQGHH